MRVGILSDIHSNVEAMRATLEDAERRELDALVCLGDIVGYGADPAACLDLVLESCAIVVAGNHDLATTGQLATDAFNPLALAAVRWTRAQLTREQLARLEALPLEASCEDLLLVHACPARPADFPYLRDPESAAEAFAERDFRVSAFGHTHHPVTFLFDGEVVRASLNPNVDLSRAGSFLCNVGSVGQPRDHDPRACYAVYDSARQRLTRHRVTYDVDAASEKILRAGLPEPLGERLLVGI